MNSGYGVRISARAERDLLRLPEKISGACLTFIFGRLTEEPYRLGKELHGKLAGLQTARSGSYRIIYRINAELRRIDIVHIDHRADVYR